MNGKRFDTDIESDLIYKAGQKTNPNDKLQKNDKLAYEFSQFTNSEKLI